MGCIPAVLRMINLTTDAATKHGKWVGVCGGIAADLGAVPVLIGLGVKELSVTIPTIAAIKAAIGRLTLSECQALGRGGSGAGDGGAGPRAAGAFRGITVGSKPTRDQDKE